MKLRCHAASAARSWMRQRAYNPVDDVNAHPIGECEQIYLDGDVRTHAVWRRVI